LFDAALSLWLCDLHNKTNERDGNDKMDFGRCLGISHDRRVGTVNGIKPE